MLAYNKEKAVITVRNFNFEVTERERLDNSISKGLYYTSCTTKTSSQIYLKLVKRLIRQCKTIKS